MTLTYILLINNVQYTQADKIIGINFKKKKNQVGTFSFQAHSLTSSDLENIKERNIIQVYIYVTLRFQGFIKKVRKDKRTGLYTVEGESLEGILNTVSTPQAVSIRMGYNGELPTTKELVHEAMFRFGYLKNYGSDGWRIIGGNGIHVPFYRFEMRTLVDHIANLARLSGYDWRCYC